MTALVWDKSGERRYETGVDRGVLYPPSGAPVVWNGLTSIVETRSRNVKSYFIDGIKYLDYAVPSAYAAKVQAYTYPDVLDSLLGNNSSLVPGLNIHDQQAKMFDLSYRTLIANDTQGSDYAYTIHLLYNITASPSDATFNTISDSFSGSPFEWNLVATPNRPFGFRPTSHFSVDSRKVSSSVLSDLENTLYGTTLSSPHMPDLGELAGIINP